MSELHPVEADRPVVLSYGMGVDSTALLVRWLDDPTSRDFALDQLVCLVAMTGDEFAETGSLVERFVLPMLADAGVRLVQVARGGPSRADGIVVLDDSTRATRVHLDGQFRLSDELRTAGTLPQFASNARRCSIKAKGEPLDAATRALVGDSPYRHVIGFNADEQRRAVRDTSYTHEGRAAEYPLIDWGWGREECEAFLEDRFGFAWPKSACSYCPFSRSHHLDRWAAEPDAAVDALLLERTARALNPRMTLFPKTQAEALVRAKLPAVAARFDAELEAGLWALYDVRRVFFARRDGSGRKGSAARSVRTVTTGSHAEVMVVLRQQGLQRGRFPVADDGIERVVLDEPANTFPTVERFLVVAPAGVADKQRPSFERWWADIKQVVAA